MKNITILEGFERDCIVKHSGIIYKMTDNKDTLNEQQIKLINEFAHIIQDTINGKGCPL